MGRRQKLALVVALCFTVCVIVVSIKDTHVVKGAAAVLAALPLAYPEPPETNTFRGMESFCRAVTEFNASSERKQWKAEALGFNARNAVSASAMIDKISVWPHGEMSKPPILCITYSQDSGPRATAVHKNWGHRCDEHLIFANSSNVKGVPSTRVVELHPFGGDGTNNIWQKLRAVLRWLAKWDRLTEFQYFFFSGDKTFVVVDNLRKMLLEPHYDKLNQLKVPLYLGHRMVASSASNTPFVSGAGYVLNLPALRILTVGAGHSSCKPEVISGSEDIIVAECFQKFGVFPLNTADELGEDRIHVFSPALIVDTVKHPERSWWFPKYRIRPMPHGLEAVSKFSVSFNYIEPEEGERMHQKLYHP